MLMKRHLRDCLLLAPPAVNGQTDAARGAVIRAALIPMSCDFRRKAYGETRVDRARLLYDGSRPILSGARVTVGAGTELEKTYCVTQVRRYPLFQEAQLQAEEAPLC